MRRLRILFYWLFYHKNNVSVSELFQFLTKPQVAAIAAKFIKEIQLKEYYEVSFHKCKDILYWPTEFSVAGLNQVTAETFDSKDWHFYQKENTTVQTDDVLLDIGTAEGLFPLTVVNKCSKIIMVEPNSIFYATLSKTFASYLDKVTIHKSAVGNLDGYIGFDENSLAGQVNEGINSAQISIHKIDTLVPADQKIDYLKADIEGFEYEMLKGAKDTITRNKPRIAITTYHKQNNPEDIISIIKSYVPEYKHMVKGIHEEWPKPVMIHFWI